MKKILTFALQLILISYVIFPTIGCFNPFIKNQQPNPSEPIEKSHDINYYEKLIEENKNYIIDCQEWITEIKNNKNDYDNKDDYQSALDEVQAEIFFYQSNINEYQYQILILTVNGNSFSSEQILEAISILNTKINNLQQELNLKEKYLDYYSEQELQEIEEQILKSKNLLNFFNNLKE